VRQGSEAERAGFRKNDVILEFDGMKFRNTSELRAYIFRLPIGKVVPVKVKRGDSGRELQVTVGVKRKYDSEFSF
jgi:S1-C subfamily serine protease